MKTKFGKNVSRNLWLKFNNFMGFERTLKLMCWPWGVIYRLWYNYESFPRFVDDPKRVYIAMKDQKKFWWKKFFIEISDPNLTFFRSLKNSQTIGTLFICLLLFWTKISWPFFWASYFEFSTTMWFIYFKFYFFDYRESILLSGEGISNKLQPVSLGNKFKGIFFLHTTID